MSPPNQVADFPYHYVGGGYFRRKGVPNINKDPKGFKRISEELRASGIPLIIHGEDIINYILKHKSKND